jgi:SAM-dependent methyltransferase
VTDDWSGFADHMGAAYLRYSFTKGTANEVAFLWDALGLAPGMSVLDVGCGPGRHALALAARGAQVVGIDIAPRFIELGNEAAALDGLSARFTVGDARALPYIREFDAVISLCQGGFGLVGRAVDGSADAEVLDGMIRALKPGGRVALSAFSAYFQLRHLEPTDRFDAGTAVNTEASEIRNEAGNVKPIDLHSTCFTPLELRLLAERSGLMVNHVWSVTPGDYGRYPLTIDRQEFLLVGTRPDVP